MIVSNQYIPRLGLNIQTPSEHILYLIEDILYLISII